jgi:hypothetical protein
VACTGPNEPEVGRRELTSTEEITLPPPMMISADTWSDEPLRWLR